MSWFVFKEDNSYHVYQHREQALEGYERNDGTRIEYCSGYNGNMPQFSVLIDKPDVDIRLVRKDEDIVNKTSIAMQNAIRKYDDNNTIQVKLKLNSNTDKDIIDYLNSCGNKQGKIKELIRKEMSRN